jgi:peptidoglycan/xylan/chitin deacetylase (PgdA/CDA1 family)
MTTSETDAWRTNVPILMYHHLESEHPAKTPHAISTRQFEDQLDTLLRHEFTTVSFARLLNARAGGSPLPNKSVLLTFDDGYLSFFDYAVPALRSRGMTATSFLVAGELGRFNQWDDSSGMPRRLLMGQTHVEKIVASGFEIGSHGWRHRDLLACSRDELDEELQRSRQTLIASFGIQTTIFAYPYGRYSEALYTSLACAGYQAAVTASSIASDSTNNCFALRRADIHTRDTRLSFRLKISPFYLRYKAFRNRKPFGFIKDMGEQFLGKA